MLIPVLMLGIVLLLAFLGTVAVRRYALMRQIMDIPNARSSHAKPTPRGGGVAIVAIYLLSLVVWNRLHGVPAGLFWSLLCGGGLIAFVGFWDDRSHLPARVRFAVHLLVSVAAVFALGGWPTLDLGFDSITWGPLGFILGVVGVTWAINLYNFMDGIDGLAGSQAVFVAGAAGWLLMLSGADPMPLWLLAASSAGFLLLNWPPARIFMGDAGSGFLGYALGVHALQSTVTGTMNPWPWLILLGVFCVDATFTLLHRAWLRICVTDAHRTHAYQWAARRCGSHKMVTLGIFAINLFILFPAALCAAVFPHWAMLCTGFCLVGLVWLAWHFDAGVPEAHSRSAHGDDSC